MKLGLFAILTLAGCNSCQPASSPVTDTQVYGELVEAGCLASSDGGVAAVAAEHATGHDAWLACLYDGGTVQGCAVPCTKGK